MGVLSQWTLIGFVCNWNPTPAGYHIIILDLAFNSEPHHVGGVCITYCVFYIA